MTVKAWIRRRLGASAATREADARPLSEVEFALIDVDLTGIDRDKDEVSGVAVLPLVDGGFRLDHLRYCRFPSAGAPSEAAAADLRRDYEDLLRSLGKRAVFTYNPRFVGWMLGKTTRRLMLPEPQGEWFDIAAAAAVIGTDTVEATSMDYWLRKMKAGGQQEHDAVYDVFAMAQLLQAILAYADEMGIENLADLIRNQKARAWLRPY